MVRNRSTNWLVNNWKRLGDKLSSAVLVASAIAIWMIIIAAITFLMIDNGRLRDTLRGHDKQDIKDENERKNLREDIKDIHERLEALEEQK